MLETYIWELATEKCCVPCQVEDRSQSDSQRSSILIYSWCLYTRHCLCSEQGTLTVAVSVLQMIAARKSKIMYIHYTILHAETLHYNEFQDPKKTNTNIFISWYYTTRSWNSVVGIVTMVWSGDPGFKSWHGEEIFLFSKCSDWLWGSSSFLLNEYQGSFLEARQLGHEVDHSPPTGAEVKNE